MIRGKNIYQRLIWMVSYLENIPYENAKILIDSTFTGKGIQEVNYPETSKSETVVLEGILIELGYFEKNGDKEILEDWRNRINEVYESIVIRKELV